MIAVFVFITNGLHFEAWSDGHDTTELLFKTRVRILSSPRLNDQASLHKTVSCQNDTRFICIYHHHYYLTQETDNIFYSVKTTPKYYKSRLNILKATWFQVVERDKVSYREIILICSIL